MPIGISRAGRGERRDQGFSHNSKPGKRGRKTLCVVIEVKVENDKISKITSEIIEYLNRSNAIKSQKLRLKIIRYSREIIKI